MVGIHQARSRVMQRAVAVGIALSVIPVLLLAQGMTPKQVMDLQSVTSVAMSPDASLVAYTVSKPRTDTEPYGRSYSELWIVPARGGTPRAVLQAPNNASRPAWSPDGQMLTFVARLRDHHDLSQVYGVPARGGDPKRITNAPHGVMAYAWSPTGDAIAYTSRQPVSDETKQLHEMGDDEWAAGENERHVQLWVEELASGSPRTLTRDDHTVWDFTWAPDGTRLAVQMSPSSLIDYSYMFRHLHTVALSDGKVGMLARTPGKLGQMEWSPDGSRLAYIGAVSQNDPLAQSVFVLDMRGGEPTNRTPGYEGSVTWIGWENDGNLLFLANEGTKTALNRVGASSGGVERLVGGNAEVMNGVSFDKQRRSFATAASTASAPPEVYVGSTRSNSLARVTQHNPWLAGVELAPQETVAWWHPDGTRVEGVLVRPLRAQQGVAYPLAILPHGGPEGVSRDGWNTRGLYPAQVLASQGYAVLMPNYRGSGGRGVAFSKADHRDLGGKEFEDVIAGIDYLAEQGLVDPNRVGISGTSYGGYFSAWATARHPDRFQAGITFAGITNWVSFTGTTDIPYEMSLVHWDLWWFDNPGLAWDRSPIAHVDENTSPTLIGHGAEDARVHPAQSYELYTALKIKKVPTGLVIYPREPHGLLERAHQLDFMRRMTEWFDRYLKAPEAATM